MGWQPSNHCQTASVSSGSSLCISAEESTQSATVGRGCRLSIATGELSIYPGGSGLLRSVAKRSRFAGLPCASYRVRRAVQRAFAARFSRRL